MLKNSAQTIKNRWSRDLLLELLDDDKFGTPEYLLFYGHKQEADGTITSSCFSQWYQAKFKINDIDYTTAEQFMMAEKARLFEDEKSLHEILASTTPAEAKALGRKVQNFNDDIWKSKCVDIVVEANSAKFSQNTDLANWLRLTGDRILVEASPRDRIWGIGMGKNNPDALNPRKWRGSNLLGFALMDVRAL